MTIEQIYNLFIKKGIEEDLRGKKQVEKILARLNKKYEKLDKEKKKEFDKEKLTNPFSDTRILNDPSASSRQIKKPIKKILTGVDIGVGELMMAKHLGNIDLVLSHHPLGNALANLDDVMRLQADVLNMDGIPINVAESLIHLRMEEVSRSFSPINHYQVVDAAKLLNIGLMCSHTVADNCVASFLKRLIERKKPEYVEDILDLLKLIPEYQQAIKRGAGPTLFAGKPENHCGKISLTEITGGTSGSKHIYEKLAQAGVGTIVAMHMSEEHLKNAEKAHVNVIIAGHIASDSIGMNLLLDELAKKKIEIIPCSGLIRVERF